MLQKSVGLYPAIGIPGQQVHLNQAVYTPENFVSDGTARAGGFVFLKAPEDSGRAYQTLVASATAAAGTKVLGFVERTQTGVLPCNTVASDIYQEGENLTIAVRGDYYIVAPASATLGQSVLCDPTTGDITFGAAGATNDTGWVVKKAGDEGDTIIISNHGIDVA